MTLVVYSRVSLMTEHPCILNAISLSDVQTTHINFTETVDTESTKKLGLGLRLKGMKYRYKSCSKFKKKEGENNVVEWFSSVLSFFDWTKNRKRKKNRRRLVTRVTNEATTTRP